MESFQLRGKNGHIKISLIRVFGFPDKTTHWGGYGAICLLELVASVYAVKSEFWTSTGELFHFYEQFKTCQERLAGKAAYKNYERNLSLYLEYDQIGHSRITGEFREYALGQNVLQFEITGDQSYFTDSLSELGLIVGKYGSDKGVG